MSFRAIRITVLLTLLLSVGLVSLNQHTISRSWKTPLEVVIYPIIGDVSVRTQTYVDELRQADFDIIERWGMREAQRHGLPLDRPLSVRLGPKLDAMPPWLPQTQYMHEVILWSLKFRYWAWQNTPPSDRGGTRVRIFVIYQQGLQGQALDDSLGMQKGLLGLVNAFADTRMNEQNNIVIAHELLHTVGASDKYDGDNQPVYPQGYAEPERDPSLPQKQAEIMAGRLLSADGRAIMPDSLREVIINRYTAEEINWINPPGS